MKGSEKVPTEQVAKTDEIKRQVEEVAGIIQSNVDMMKNRGENIESMQIKSGIGQAWSVW